MPNSIDDPGPEEDDNPISEFFMRPIKTYVLRAGRMSEGEKRSYADLHQVWCIPFEHKTLNFTEIFLCLN